MHLDPGTLTWLLELSRQYRAPGVHWCYFAINQRSTCPFRDILDLDLTLPTEKVHEVADIAVANANAAVTELRRLFLVEDFIDSLKFGVLLWSLTYLGAWFNGMTLIIIGQFRLNCFSYIEQENSGSSANLRVTLLRISPNSIASRLSKRTDIFRDGIFLKSRYTLSVQ